MRFLVSELNPADRALTLNALLLARDELSSGGPKSTRQIKQLCARLSKRWPDCTGLAREAAAVSQSTDTDVPAALDQLIAEIRRSQRANPSEVRILVVDDDPSVRALLEMATRPFATTVYAVASVAEAKAIIQITPLSLVILDLGLTDGDGRDLLIQLKSEPITEALPVLILTGNERPVDAAECLALGAHEVHRKPVDYKALSKAVAVILGVEKSRNTANNASWLSSREQLGDLATACIETFYVRGARWSVIAASAPEGSGAALEEGFRFVTQERSGAALWDRQRLTVVLPDTTATQATGICENIRASTPGTTFGISGSGPAKLSENLVISGRLLMLAGQVSSGIAASDAPETSVRRPTILVVDDDPTIPALIQAAVRQDGLDVVALERGDRLIETCQRQRPVLVILDVNLPGEHGLSLLETLRKARTIQQVPILLITGYSDPRYVEAAFSGGASDFITKPFDLRDARARINRLIQVAADHR